MAYKVINNYKQVDPDIFAVMFHETAETDHHMLVERLTTALYSIYNLNQRLHYVFSGDKLVPQSKFSFCFMYGFIIKEDIRPYEEIVVGDRYFNFKEVRTNLFSHTSN